MPLLANTLFVSTPENRTRVEAVTGPLPTWADVRTVTEFQLKSAEAVKLLFANDDSEADEAAAKAVRQTLMTYVADDRWEWVSVTKTEESQQHDDLRALRLENAKRRAQRLLDEQEAEALVVPRVKRTVADYAKVPAPASVIEHCLAAEINLLGGPSGSGKSLLARDWSLHIAAGEPWRGHAVTEPGAVVWLASEGTHDVAERWETHPLFERAAPNVFFDDVPVNLTSDRDVDRLIEFYADEQPRLIVLDVITGMGMTDDNNTKDVLPVVNRLKRISRETGAGTLSLGHSGHTTGRRFRGWSGWRQLCATEWHVADNLLTVEKSKLDDPGRHTTPVAIEYPHLRFLSPTEALADEATRHLIVVADLASNPKDSDRRRAERLHAALGLSVERARKLVSTIRKTESADD